MTSDAQQKGANLRNAIINVIWVNQKTGSFVYHWFRALATSFPAIFSGIERHFKYLSIRQYKMYNPNLSLVTLFYIYPSQFGQRKLLLLLWFPSHSHNPHKSYCPFSPAGNHPYCHSRGRNTCTDNSCLVSLDLPTLTHCGCHDPSCLEICIHCITLWSLKAPAQRVLELLSGNGFQSLGHCDLDLWPTDPKINRGLLLNKSYKCI